MRFQKFIHQVLGLHVCCLIIAVLLAMSACTPSRQAVLTDEQVVAMPDAIPVVELRSKRGNPYSYQVFGKTYHVMDQSDGFVQRGIASWYGSAFHGKQTSNGDIYDMYRMTAAHKTLPLPAYVRVINLSNGKSVVVRVNDRGPFIEGRIIDLSYVAARKLGIVKAGTAAVEIRALNANGTNSANVVVDTIHDMQSLPVTRLDEASTKPVELKSHSGVFYYIQLGAFSSLENATRLQARLEMQKHSNIQMSLLNTDKGDLYRVRKGPFMSKKQASISLLGLSHYPYAKIIKE